MTLFPNLALAGHRMQAREIKRELLRRGRENGRRPVMLAQLRKHEAEADKLELEIDRRRQL